MPQSIPIREPETDTDERRERQGGGSVAAAESDYRLDFEVQDLIRSHVFKASTDEEAIHQAFIFLGFAEGERSVGLAEDLFRTSGGKVLVRTADEEKIYPPPSH